MQGTVFIIGQKKQAFIQDGYRKKSRDFESEHEEIED